MKLRLVSFLGLLRCYFSSLTYVPTLHSDLWGAALSLNSLKSPFHEKESQMDRKRKFLKPGTKNSSKSPGNHG